MMAINCSMLPLLMVLVLVGCDESLRPATKQPEPVTATPSSPKPTEPLPIAVDEIELFDGMAHPSEERALTGDLRPVWIVSGRIRNSSSKELGGLRVRFFVTARGKPEEIEDETILDFPTDILPSSVGSFSRKIQLLPPRGAYDWDWKVIDAYQKAR
jgi:hypothetical protein